MSGLEFNKLKVNLPKILGGLVCLILVGCLLRVMIWEYNYYKDKEGSERAVSSDIINVQDVDETDVSDEDKSEYIVAANKPRYLTIEKLDIHNARILEVGVTKEGALDTPMNIFDAAWYTGSDLPGDGGTALLDGHNGGPTKVGIFKYLPNLEKGDKITIEMGDGRLFEYEVYDNKSVLLSEADSQMAAMEISPVKGQESISIISCTGEWSQTRQTYLSRQFLRAVRVK